MRQEIENGNLKNADLIIHRFLCETPLRLFNFEVLKDTNDCEIQNYIINKTIRNPSVLKYPVKLDYQRKFIKIIIEYLEENNCSIDEEWYEEYVRLLELPSGNCYKHYHDGKIVLKESSSLISNGTTGLRTWQGALVLSEWIVLNKEIFDGQNVLELGSGIGLTGLVTLLNSQPKKYLFTDGHNLVLENLCYNLKLNYGHTLINGDKLILYHRTINNRNSTIVEVLNVPWQSVNEKLSKLIGPLDYIIAADIIYDKDLFVYLFSAVECLFKYCGVKYLIIACTIRNSDTLSTFLDFINGRNHSVEDLQTPTTNEFLWDSESIVKIFRIKFLF